MWRSFRGVGRWRISVSAVVIAVLIGGCGGDERPAPSGDNAPAPASASEEEGGRRTDRTALTVTKRIARETCSVFPLRELADAYRLSRREREGDLANYIALGYATNVRPQGGFQQVAYNGCIAAVRSRLRGADE